jgi:uncharacterized membrane protein YqjE
MLSLGALVMALCWDTAYRIPAAGALAALYGLGAALAWRRFAIVSKRSNQSFAASRAELVADLTLLRSKL